mmetsp:Transcript_19887/g.35348  ORF Transcript_19887/g.35348 Transcript_19887/m.35348 type:complete len:455 (-) Transcript_19887:279-1643(-)
MAQVEPQAAPAVESPPQAPVGLVGSGTDAEDALPPLESLTCQLCFQYFSSPVTLPCLHSYCKACLESYNGRAFAQTTDSESDEEPQSEEHGQIKPKRKAKPVFCPCCKDTLGLANASFYSEPFENERISRIVALLRDTHILCQNCEKCASEFRCNVCDAYTCEACFHETHNAPIFRSHKPERLTHSEMTAPPKCDSHKINDIEYFCGSDEVGVCQVCLLKGEFKGKDYSLISDVRKERQSAIEEGISEALLQRASLIEGRKNVEETQQELDTNLASQKAAVKENFAVIRAALEKREAGALEALQALHDKKSDVLGRQLEAIDKEKSRIEDGVANINLVLNHSNDLEVIYLTYVLQGHVSELQNVQSTSPLPGGQQPNHNAAVDAELPVILSEKVPQLINAYASVGDATLVEEIAAGLQSSQVLNRPTVSKEQQAVFKEVVGKNADTGENGCILQ